MKSAKQSLLKKVKQTISRCNLLSKNDKVVVGVSGGPDSVALLLILNSLRRELNLRLQVAHLDHQLRKASYRDREFVESLAEKLNLPFTAGKIKPGRFLKKGSVEEIAREERLSFLFNLAKETKANKIALGHNQDDQAETVLMRLIRGTGLSGLGSILPRRRIGEWIIIRPLIDTPRNVIESYLRRRKIRPCLDSSNKDSAYFRNRIRNQLIPRLTKDYNPNIKETLANMAQIAASDYDYSQRVALKAFNRLKQYRFKNKKALRNGMQLNLDKLLRLHPAIQRLVLRLSIADIKGNTRRLSFKHAREIEDLILCRPLNSIVDLPGQISVLKQKKRLCIYQRKPSGVSKS
ncbi:MAG: tRNA lysidine(34) synthetase TilS [Candidatus Omnitrophota bacterium]|jgi:tRNA(Ile)-lysidine synthase